MLTLEQFLTTYCTPYGSQVWGGATDKSDYDYLLPSFAVPDLKKLLEKRSIPHRIKTTPYITVTDFLFIVELRDKTIQIVVPPTKYYVTVLNTIKLINRLSTIHPDLFISKQQRLQIFQSTFDYFNLPTVAVPLYYSLDHFPELYI
jgi:hypothetical protein